MGATPERETHYKTWIFIRVSQSLSELDGSGELVLRWVAFRVYITHLNIAQIGSN